MKKEIYSLTSLRFIAAFYVFLFHCQIHYGAITTSSSANTVINHGQVGMSIFFILSGYILSFAYKKVDVPDLKKYFINRIARIYPTYLFYGILSLPFFISNIDQIEALAHISNLPYIAIIQFLLAFIAFIFMFQAWYPSILNIWNFGGSWSLSVEAFFYILFPLIRNIANISSKKTLLYGLLISYIWASIPMLFLNFFSTSQSFHIMDTYTYSSPIFRLGEFIFGVLLYILFIEQVKSPIKINKYILILCYIILGAYFLNVNFFIGLSAFNFIVIPVIAITILYLHNSDNFILKNRIFVYLGHISYSFYLAQFIVFGMFKIEIKNFTLMSIEIKWIFAFITTLLIAMTMYHIIEKPSRYYIRLKYQQ